MSSLKRKRPGRALSAAYMQPAFDVLQASVEREIDEHFGMWRDSADNVFTTRGKMPRAKYDQLRRLYPSAGLPPFHLIPVRPQCQ